METNGANHDIRWMTILGDVPAEGFDPAARFWCTVTGSRPGPAEGEFKEYLPLLPSDGDSSLWLQRVGRPTGGWHLDLHVVDADAAAGRAEDLGAVVDHRYPEHGLVVLHTPGGQPFCFIAEPADRPHRPPAPGASPAGRCLADQLCFDIPADRYDAECDFWAALTGWRRRGAHEDRPEFDRILVPGHLPAQFLLQRLEPDDQDGIRAHLDLSADDRDGEVARHVEMGAQVVRRTEGWTTLLDPAGLTYCVTGRRTGVRFT